MLTPCSWTSGLRTGTENLWFLCLVCGADDSSPSGRERVPVWGLLGFSSVLGPLSQLFWTILGPCLSVHPLLLWKMSPWCVQGTWRCCPCPLSQPLCAALRVSNFSSITNSRSSCFDSTVKRHLFQF